MLGRCAVRHWRLRQLSPCAEQAALCSRPVMLDALRQGACLPLHLTEPTRKGLAICCCLCVRSCSSRRLFISLCLFISLRHCAHFSVFCVHDIQACGRHRSQLSTLDRCDSTRTDSPGPSRRTTTSSTPDGQLHLRDDLLLSSGLCKTIVSKMIGR